MLINFFRRWRERKLLSRQQTTTRTETAPVPDPFLQNYCATGVSTPTVTETLCTEHTNQHCHDSNHTHSVSDHSHSYDTGHSSSHDSGSYHDSGSSSYDSGSSSWDCSSSSCDCGGE